VPEEAGDRILETGPIPHFHAREETLASSSRWCVSIYLLLSTVPLMKDYGKNWPGRSANVEIPLHSLRYLLHEQNIVEGSHCLPSLRHVE
jgi:hypothetical protein